MDRSVLRRLTSRTRLLTGTGHRRVEPLCAWLDSGQLGRVTFALYGRADGPGAESLSDRTEQPVLRTADGLLADQSWHV
jgi:hypothetical protein